MRFKQSLLIVCFAFSSTSIASLSQAHANVIVGFGSYIVFEQANDGYNYELRQPIAGRLGYGFSEVDLIMEYARFRADQGAQAIEVSRLHEETILWMRHTLKKRWVIAPFLALGAGFQRDTITTRFNSDTTTEKGTLRGMASLALGARWSITENLSLDAEGRAASSQNFSPNPMFRAGASLAWKFR